MPSTARNLLLEIRRRLGDVNESAFDETDMLALLNRALRGIWNYGAYRKAPYLQRTCRVSSVSGDSFALDGGALNVLSVYDHGSGRPLFSATPQEAMAVAVQGGSIPRVFVATPTAIDLFPERNAGADLSVCYIPEFTPLKSRDDEMPFPSSLDAVIVEWALFLASDKGQSTSDFEPALSPVPGSLSAFFRGIGPRLVTGTPPW